MVHSSVSAAGRVHSALTQLPSALANAFYIPADPAQTDGIMTPIAHHDGNDFSRRRFDERVLYRRLNPAQSAAAHASLKSDIIVSPSTMFPEEHIVANYPVSIEGRHGAETCVLQTVFDRQGGTVNAQIRAHRDKMSALMGKLPTAFSGALTARDRLPQFATYRPDIILLIDINHFTDLSEQNGYVEADVFAELFFEKELIPFLEQEPDLSDTELLDVRGDGLWMRLPIDPCNTVNAAHEEQTVRHLSHRIFSLFEHYTCAYGKGFPGASIKIAADMGEVWARDYGADQLQNRSGPVFTRITSLVKTAPRTRSSLLIGEDLMQRWESVDIEPVQEK